MMPFEDDLLDLEEKTLRLAAGGWINAIDELRVLLASEPEKVKARILRLAVPSMDGPALKALAEAFGLGLGDALEVVGTTDEDIHRAAAKKAGVSKEAREAVTGMTAAAKKELAKAVVLISSGASPETALAPLFASRASTKRSITWAINTAANDAEVVVAKSAGLPLVWEAERDACVHCLRYSGEVSKTGLFKPGLTYGKTALKTKGAPSCPLHPNCRCRMRPLRDQGYADALRREADRSILRGFSLPTESMRARVDAADRLLSKSPKAPASVKAFARKAIEKGEFTSRRPGGQ